ncbi:hypothetical protein DFH27DRAFT_229506 [Peziza echinospora]|nr:hypothetical protein DFH27DRAFT_229506 [Peziza echinospora]
MPKAPKPLPSPSPSASDGADESVFHPKVPDSPLSLPSSVFAGYKRPNQHDEPEIQGTPKRPRVSASSSPMKKKMSPAVLAKKKTPKKISSEKLIPAEKSNIIGQLTPENLTPTEKLVPTENTSSEYPKHKGTKRPHSGVEAPRRTRIKLNVESTGRKASSKIERRDDPKQLLASGSNGVHLESSGQRRAPDVETERKFDDKENKFHADSGNASDRQSKPTQKTVTPATPESTVSFEEDTEKTDPFTLRKKAIGLQNLGQTCYNNAVVQALSSSMRFRKALREMKVTKRQYDDRVASHKRKMSPSVSAAPTRRTRRVTQMETHKQNTTLAENVSLSSELADLVDCIVYENADAPAGKRAVVNPHEFGDACNVVMPIFERHYQHDSQEFLRVLLEKMDQENSASEGSPEGVQNYITSLFAGKYRNTNACKECPKKSTKTDEFLDFSLDIPQSHEPLGALNRKSARAKKGPIISVPLKECIDLFAKPEEMEYSPCSSPEPKGNGSQSQSSASTPKCPDCNVSERFTKTLRIESCPEILCLHFKRFQYRGGVSHKITTHVDFPIDELDLEPWMISEHQESSTKYRMVASIAHEGDRADGGHYLTYANRNNIWWQLNDDKARQVTTEDVRKSNAYLLFYERI